MNDDVVNHKIGQAANGLGKRLIRGVGAGLVGQILSLLSRLLLPPMFLKAWGVDVYGDWLLISAVVANLALSEVGGGVYIINRLTQAFAKGETRSFRATLQTALMIFVTWPAAIFLMLLLMVTFVPIGSIIGIKSISGDVVRLVAVVLAFQVFVGIPNGLILGVYRAVGDLPRGVMLANYILLMQIVLVGSGLWLSAGVVIVGILQFIPILVVASMAIREINGKFPEFHLFSFRDFDLDIAKQFLRPSAHFFLIQLSLALSIQGTVIVTGLLLGSAQVVVFATMRTLSNVVKSMLGLVSHAAWPDMTKLEAEHDISRLSMLFTALVRTNTVATTIIVFILACCGQTVYEAWLGKTILFNQSIMNLFLLLLAQQVSWTVYGNLLMATNKHHGLSLVTLASAIASVSLAYIGAKMDGIEGLLWGMIAAEVLLPLWIVPYFVHRHYGNLSPAMFFKETAPLVLALPMVLEPRSAIVIAPLLLMWWWRAAKPFFEVKKQQ